MYAHDDYMLTSSVGLYCNNNNGIFSTQTWLIWIYMGLGFPGYRRIGNELIREYTYNNSGLYIGR